MFATISKRVDGLANSNMMGYSDVKGATEDSEWDTSEDGGIYPFQGSTGVVDKEVSNLVPISSSSSSSRSSVLTEDQDGYGLTYDAYQRQPLLVYDAKPNEDALTGKLHTSGSFSKDKETIIRLPPHRKQHHKQPRFPNEIFKTVVALAFLVFSILLTALLHVLTHERVPEVPRLPDIIIDNTNIKSWGLVSPDIPLMICVYSAITVIVFHKYRILVIRRVLFLMGLIYFYRAIAFYVTVLPVPRAESHCLPKLNTTDILPVLKRMGHIFSNFGMTNVIFCGDYIYSGHTACFVMSYLIIKEYSPKRWWFVHFLYGMLSFLGAMMLIVFGNHYTIDCAIAYVITTRLFYIYHTLANNQKLKENGRANYFERVWWFPIFKYFEKNVQGVIPRHYNWPLPWPRSWRNQTL